MKRLMVWFFYLSLENSLNLNLRCFCVFTLWRLEIKQVAEGTLEVPGLVDTEVHSTEEVWELLKAGGRNRAVGSTNANLLSSRSHWYQMILCFFFPSISYYLFVSLFDQRKQNLKYLQYFMLQKIEYSVHFKSFFFS